MKKQLFFKPILSLFLFCLGLLANAQSYELTSTYYKNYFTDTAVNTDDFVWAVKPDWAGSELIQDGDLQVTNTAFASTRITDTLRSTIDISANPIFSMDAKLTNADDTVVYVLELQDADGGSSYGQFEFEIIGNTYQKVVVEFAGSWANLAKIDYFGFNCQESDRDGSQKQSIYIDNLFLGDTTSTITSNESLNVSADNIVAYPNPLPKNEILTIDFSTKENITSAIVIRNSLGQVVYQQEVLEQVIYIPANELKSGVYVIEAIGNNNSKTTKLLVGPGL